MYGRLELVHDNIWGTICRNQFNHINAEIACFEMGHGGGLHITPSGNYYNRFEGEGKIWANVVKCLGSEDYLDECTADWCDGIESECEHREDAGISCIKGCPNTIFTFNLLRLVNTNYDIVSENGRDCCNFICPPIIPVFGVLELYHNNKWKTVCN